MIAEAKFICDDHCGRLARWLRVVGYDCLYTRDIDDNTLLKRATAENRVILTRDTKMTEKAMARRVLVIDSPSPLIQLRQVLDGLNLMIDPARIGTRCSVCNGPAESVALDTIADRVPPYVRQTQTSFRECADCHRVYWHGTHVKNMIRELNAAGLLN